MATPATIPNRRLHLWVPADQRWLGLDRRTLLPAGIVLAVVVVMHWVIPWVDSLVPYREQIQAGQTMSLDRDIRFAPPAGWGISSGVVTGDAPASGVYPDSAAVFSGPTSLSVTTDAFAGSPRELLRQIQLDNQNQQAFALDAKATPITTASGIPGLISEFRDTTSDGAIAVFTVDGTGIEVVIRTPSDTTSSQATEIGQTLSSISETAATR
jgi:hypothetical protein